MNKIIYQEITMGIICMIILFLIGCVPQIINVVSDNGICVGQHVDIDGYDNEIYYVDPNHCVILEEALDMYFDENGGEL